jgi:hypothetical protein
MVLKLNNNSDFDSVPFSRRSVSLPHLFLEQERHREVLQQLRASGAHRGIPPTKEIVAVGHSEFEAMLEKYDTDHHGNIDAEEVHAVLTELNTRKQQSDLLKKILWGAFAFLVFLLISNTLLTVLMIKMTKDVYIDNNSMVSSKGDMLKTEKPKFYTSISSLTSLPVGALDAITRMTFTTVDGGVYNLMVNGKREKINSNQLYLLLLLFVFLYKKSIRSSCSEVAVL